MTITCDSTTTYGDGCDLLLYYDKDNDGVISQAELLDNIDSAVNDKIAGTITQEEYEFVIRASAFGSGSIESVCQGCYEEEEDTVTCDSHTTYGDGCDLLLYYDADNDGIISTTERSSAIHDKEYGTITRSELIFVQHAWSAGSINSLCPGCHIDEGETITCNHAVHYPTGCDLLLAYDADGDGAVTYSDANRAANDGMTNEEVRFIIDAVGAGSINALCPGCYSEDGEAIFRVVEFTVPSSCNVPCNVDIHIKWQNVGTTSGSFIPKYEINGIPYTDPQQTLMPNAMYTIDDVVSITSAGTYEICPYPNE